MVAEAARDLQLRDGGPDGTVAKRRRGVRQMGTGTGGEKMRVLASEKWELIILRRDYWDPPSTQ